MLSGYPKKITELLCSKSEKYKVSIPWNDNLIKEAIDDILEINKNKEYYEINNWIIFIKSQFQRYKLIEKYFPKRNKNRKDEDKDRMSIATYPEEMLMISNHLYVLKSYGLEGYFLEFGCYKGFSSSCLSLACEELNINMEIFDSFQGLPDVGHGFYRPGDYCGNLDEVKNNISTFGKINKVNFNKGFFEDSLVKFDKNPILCIWMDVDLYKSSKDISSILNKLPSYSCVFTHEFPQMVDKQGISMKIDPNDSEVLPPIINKFIETNKDPIGRYITCHLGAIWDKNNGIPTLPFDCILKVLNSN